MANGFGSLYVGSSGLRSAQNSLNVVANNLANIDTEGYVRQQVIFEDKNYQQFDIAAVAKQKAGLGVDIGDVVHYRDQFIDRTYRTASGRQSFYETCYEGTQEIETLLRELTGAGYSDTVNDMYEVMSEFAKDPSDTANQSVLLQTASLWLEQTQAIYQSIKDYQKNLNTQIVDSVKKINSIADDVHKLNIQIQRIEAAGVETAMDLRDARDSLIDELSSYASIEYDEMYNGMVWIKVEGTYLVTDSKAYHMETYVDPKTTFRTPYWTELSEPEKDQYYEVFRTKGIDATKKNDVGELKALLLTRGDHFATYLDIKDLSAGDYENYLANSVAMNTAAQFDLFVNNFVNAINDLLAPTMDMSESPYDAGLPWQTDPNGVEYVDALDVNGNAIKLYKETRVIDEANCSLGSDNSIPPYELFTRSGCDRFSPVFVAGRKDPIYVYNEEEVIEPEIKDVFRYSADTSRCYTTGTIHINSALVKDPTKIGYKKNNPNQVDIAYDMAERFTTIWEEKNFHLSPSDTTPTNLSGFYTKLVGDLANRGYVYKTNSETLDKAVESIWDTRQGVVGVSSDEELVNMIRFQNAYNASSRYMTVISQMIEHLVTSLGR